MPTPTSTEDFYRRGQELTAATLISTSALWDQVDLADIVTSWGRVRPQIVTQVAAAQVASAEAAIAYVPDVLDELHLPTRAVADVVPRSLIGGSSGVPLDEVLDRVPLRALHVIEQGFLDQAEERARALLEGIVRTQLADAARGATSLGIAARPRVGGYVRMLNPPSCSRCVLLAGRWFRWNTGFRRHPRCDCRHIPASENVAGDLTTDPDAYFQSLTRAQQDRIFTEAGAQAIRDGADVGQVVNARAGMTFAGESRTRISRIDGEDFVVNERRRTAVTQRVHGQDVLTTTTGTTSRGAFGRAQTDLGKTPGQRYRVTRTPRLMPESVYQIASSRDDAIRLLRRYGYLT